MRPGKLHVLTGTLWGLLAILAQCHCQTLEDQSKDVNRQLETANIVSFFLFILVDVYYLVCYMSHLVPLYQLHYNRLKV